MSKADEILRADVADGDAADAAAALGERRARLLRGWVIPSIIGTALLMSSLSASSVATALPGMARDFDLPPLRLNIVITAYLLALAVFLPISGWLADRFGAKRILMVAILLFAAASAACGFAQNLNQLIAFRLLQGCAGAMIAPVGRLVLLRTTPRNELVGALSALTIPVQLGPLLGPLIGGAVVSFVSWHWIFFLNLPIAVVGLALVRAFVPNVAEQEVAPIDWPGVLLTGIGMGALIFGLDNLMGDALPAAWLVACLGIGLGSMLLYGRYARARPNAIVDLSLFRLQTFRASVIGGAFFRLIPGATPFLLAMLLQVGFGMSAFGAGLMTFMAAVGSLIMKTVAPPILRRFGFRTVLIVNGILCALVFASYALFEADTPRWLIMAGLAGGGFFRALQLTSVTGLAFADVEEKAMSRATTTSAMVQQLVQSISTSFAAALLYGVMTARGEAHLTSAAVTPAFAIIGAAALLSQLWFLRLPRDAGESMTTGAR